MSQLQMETKEKQIQTSQNQSDSDEKICPRTDQKLWETTEKGETRWLAPHGQCCACGRWFHMDAMHSWTNHSYPIQIIGGWCLTCYKMPLSKGDPLNSIKIIG